MTVGQPIPNDVALLPGETIVRTIPSGIAMVPSAYVIRTPDGKIVISWRTVRTIPYDTIAPWVTSGVEAIKFVEGSLRFRVTRGTQTFFVVQVLERPETGLLYLMANANTMRLSILMKEQEVACLEVITTIPTDNEAIVGYVVEIPPMSPQPGFANFLGAPVDGAPDHLAVLPTRDMLLVEFRSSDGSRIETWLQPHSP